MFSPKAPYHPFDCLDRGDYEPNDTLRQVRKQGNDQDENKQAGNKTEPIKALVNCDGRGDIIDDINRA